jgi:hypothetical protein
VHVSVIVANILHITDTDQTVQVNAPWLFLFNQWVISHCWDNDIYPVGKGFGTTLSRYAFERCRNVKSENVRFTQKALALYPSGAAAIGGIDSHCAAVA